MPVPTSAQSTSQPGGLYTTQSSGKSTSISGGLSGSALCAKNSSLGGKDSGFCGGRCASCEARCM